MSIQKDAGHVDIVGEKIMLRYLSKKVELQEEGESSKPKMGFLK